MGLVRVGAAPLVEEFAYRFILQEGGALALRAFGLNPTIAKVISFSLSAFMFGMAHHPDIRGERFAKSLIPGIVLGIIQEKGSFFEAVAAHSLYNQSQYLI